MTILIFTIFIGKEHIIFILIIFLLDGKYEISYLDYIDLEDKKEHHYSILKLLEEVYLSIMLDFFL